ncbi:MAG: uncharacterized Zn finger protein (UPF0148 family) [Natronomonas sp.]|jgi:uncharacterized Zn finger protein (UPF0148 family)|uniref:hypothetical protein n=1 Tax=Natronomonas sp. TaxID=2184060 RepID=UPI00398995B9
MASSSASRERIVCSACKLPFYADEETCPYCGGDVAEEGESPADEGEFVFGGPGEDERPRTTCPTCGLPHYEDADGCPYCSYAGGGRATAPSASKEPASPEPSADERTSLFGRLKSALGF